MGWNDHDRGPEADAEERIRSAHRAIEIREKRRRVLLSRPAQIALDMGRCLVAVTGRGESEGGWAKQPLVWPSAAGANGPGDRGPLALTGRTRPAVC